MIFFISFYFNINILFCVNWETNSIYMDNSIALNWATKNLDVDHFRNGDLIKEARLNSEWELAGKNGIPA
jgi:hypothetical protein